MQNQNNTHLILPNLEKVGGQLFIDGQVKYNDFEYDFSKLKSVCMSNDPQYKEDGAGFGGLDIRLGFAQSITLPALEEIGGHGLTIRTCMSFDAPKLHTIDGTFSVQVSQISTLGTPELKVLKGVDMYWAEDFYDFTMFAPFINDGQITEERWKVEGCGYNPTYQDMKEGRYKPAE